MAGWGAAGQEGSWEDSSGHWCGHWHRRPTPGVAKEDTRALWGLWVNLVGQRKPRTWASAAWWGEDGWSGCSFPIAEHTEKYNSPLLRSLWLSLLLLAEGFLGAPPAQMCSWCFCSFWGRHVATAAVWQQSRSWATGTATCLARSACPCSRGEDSSLSPHLLETVGRNSRRKEQKRDGDKTVGSRTRIQPAPSKTGVCRECFGKQPYKWHWDHTSAVLQSWPNREAIR